MLSFDLVQVPGTPLFVNRETLDIVHMVDGYPAKVAPRLCNGRHIVNTGSMPKRMTCAQVYALAFLPKPPNAKIVRHRNGDPSDDRIENLEWVVATSPDRKALSRKFREDNCYMAFADSATGKVKQYWCDKKAVAHLMDLKPRARGPFRPEYMPRTKHLRRPRG